MSPLSTATPALPTRSEIESWDASALDDAALHWRKVADTADDAFIQHRLNLESPGGTPWSGDAKDAAISAIVNDTAVVGRQGDLQREAATIAETGGADCLAAQRTALAAIAEAEADGFTVGDDLSITDTLFSDQESTSARQMNALEHAENVRWNAERLAQTDALIGERLTDKAAELDSVRFDGESDDRNGTVRFVNDERPSPKDEAVERGAEPRNPTPEPGTWPPPGTQIEGGTPGGDPYPGGLGEPVAGESLTTRPEPPAWTPVDPGSGAFGSWDPRNPGDLVAKRTVEAGILAKRGDLPHATRNLDHYMGVTGAPLEQDVGAMMADIPVFSGDVDQRSVQLGGDAIARAQAMGATGPMTFPVNTDWRGMAAGASSTGAEYDWFLASGNFDYNMAGEVTVYPPAEPGGRWTYALDSDVNIRDRYNWDIGKQTPIMGTPITDAQMARFHLIGYAQEFTMTGSTGVHRAG